ncbi:hypothetical protein P7K49_030892 [Saguinus oedipus]|uniref:Cadherin domain-containing protein n=1 Tax=Saguinus oedipus TaxID=9490 RepID=A0ABQ9U3G0_SAGOE|nr:hypothetical protein P7K49_030892 [Saguinus oedipus]
MEYYVKMLADVLAFPNFVIENANPLLENASEHTQVAKITVSVSPHAALVGDPVIINANPAVHPFVLSRRSTHVWEIKANRNELTSRSLNRAVQKPSENHKGHRKQETWLFITGVPKLDFETVTLYSLTIYAEDNQGATASQTILIQIADVNEPPTFAGSLAQSDQVTEIYILEDTAPGTVIYRAAANDPEDAVLEDFNYMSSYDSAVKQTLKWGENESTELENTICGRRSMKHAAPRPPSPQKPILSINKQTNQIIPEFLLNSQPVSLNYFISPEGSGFTIDGIGTISTAAVFDFESESRSFSLVIKVVDPGGLFTAGNLKIFLINVNNKDPILSCSKMCCFVTEHGTVVTTTRLDVERAGFASVQSFAIKACDCDRRCAAILVTAYIHGINDNSPFCDRYLIR